MATQIQSVGLLLAVTGEFEVTPAPPSNLVSEPLGLLIALTKQVTRIPEAPTTFRKKPLINVKEEF